jgi:hypothetical protein
MGPWLPLAVLAVDAVGAGLILWVSWLTLE